MKKAQYLMVDFTETESGVSFNDKILLEYDQSIISSVDGFLKEGVSSDEVTRFMDMAAIQRIETEKFLRGAAHGPH